MMRSVSSIAGPDGQPVQIDQANVIDVRLLSPEHRDALETVLLAAEALPDEG